VKTAAKLEDISDCNISELEKEIQHKKKFLVKRHSLEFFGLVSIMSTLAYIIFFTFLASITSLFLVGFLLVHKTFMRKISFSLVAFAAGALLATGFLDTMKEAMAESHGHEYLLMGNTFHCRIFPY